METFSDKSQMIQRRIEAWAAHEKKMLQSINSVEESKRDQLLQQYEIMRNHHYRRLANMGDPAAIAFIDSFAKLSDAESIQLATATSTVTFNWYVATTGNDNNPGTQNAPFRTIQRAISISSWGNIKVEDGTYAGFTAPNNSSLMIVGNNNNPEAVVIDGTGAGSVISTGGYLSLNGMKITGGGKNGNQMVISAPYLSIRNVIITGNRSGKAIVGITAGDGVFTYDSVMDLFNTLIYDNHVDGGSESGILIGETGGDYGYYIEVSNITIANNVSSVIVQNVGQTLIFNSILYNPLSDTEVANINNVYAWIQYSNIRNYAMLVGNNNVWIGNGMIDADPKFVSPQHDMYQLADGSPCIDAGAPEFWNNDAHRPPAKGALHSDMGAYGGPLVSAQPQQVAPTGSDVRYNYDASGNRIARIKE
jgi:hypothetical protein